MPTAELLQQRFNAGATSPLLQNRTDLDAFFAGCTQLENAIVTIQGPWVRRSGLRLVTPAIDDAVKGRLATFRFSDEDAIGLEFGDKRLRFGRGRAQLVVEPTAAAVTNGSFDSDIAGWTDKSSGGGSIAWNASDQALDLVSGGSGQIAGAEQAITTDKLGQKHVVAFELRGLRYYHIHLRVGTATGLSDIPVGDPGRAELELNTGRHLVEFTPTVSPFFLQFYNMADGEFTIQLDNVVMQASGAGAPVPLELITPYAAADLFRLKHAQSADVMFLTQARYWPRELRRRGLNTWSLVESDFVDGPFLPINTDTTKTLTPSVAVNFGTLTAAGFAPFDPAHVGRMIRLTAGTPTKWGVATILSVVSPTLANVRINPNLTAAVATSEFAFGLYHGPDSHPVGASFYQERLWYAGAAEQPNRVDGSAIDDFSRFGPKDPADLQDDDAIAASIADDTVPIIRWLGSNKNLSVGSLGDEYRIGSTSQTQPLTPTNAPRRNESAWGAADIQPVRAGGSLLFVQEHARKIREQIYDLGVEGFVSPDITKRAEHLFRSAIVQLAYQKEPDSLLWAVLDDGRLLSCAFEREENVVGWSEHILPEGCHAESITAIPGAGETELSVFVRVERGGSTRRAICVLEKRQRAWDPIEADFFVDLGLSLDNTVEATLAVAAPSGQAVVFTSNPGVFQASDAGRQIRHRYWARDPVTMAWRWFVARAQIVGFTSATEVTADILIDFPKPSIAAKDWRLSVDEVTGLEFWEGQQLRVVGDGANLGLHTVQSGRIAVDPPACTVHAGLDYSTVFVANPREAQSERGSILGARQRIGRVDVFLLDSVRHYTIGRTGQLQDRRADRRAADRMDEPAPLFTGADEVRFDGAWNTESSLILVQDLPHRMTCTGIKAHLHVNQ